MSIINRAVTNLNNMVTYNKIGKQIEGEIMKIKIIYDLFFGCLLCLLCIHSANLQVAFAIMIIWIIVFNKHILLNLAEVWKQLRS